MPYRAVVPPISKGLIKARALAGIHSVILGFDFIGSAAERSTFLGFAIHRRDITSNEAWWLTGQLRFRNDPGDFGDDIPTSRAPLQKFHWGDYTVKPGHQYTYSVHPVFAKPGATVGTPNSLDLRDPVVLDVETTANTPNTDGYYFNRGVTAALAYRARFGDRPPDKVPDGAACRWLSRGLEEALLAFIGGAQHGDELKVAIYEFEHPDIITALKQAKKRGVKIWLVYHAKPGDDQTAQNEQRVQELHLPQGRVVARSEVPNISHNKIMVHCQGGQPVRVWTGSTNFTESGLFLQTNVGLVYSDTAIVRAYHDYVELLRRNLESTKMRAETAALVARAGLQLPAGRTLYFSPVQGHALLATAASLFTQAQDAVFISSPFGLDPQVVSALNKNNPAVLEYGLVNTTNRKRLLDVIDRSINTQFSAPAWIKEYDGRSWDAKAYGQHKIHVKAIVADPWGPKPRMLIGSANFSDESVTKNDENALLIENDARGAAIAATEFLRMFDHYKFRNFLKRAKKTTELRYLTEDDSWTTEYFVPSKYKFRERQVFAG